MSAITRNTFQPKCETPGVVLTRVSPFRHHEQNDKISLKIISPINTLSGAKEARKTASNYDKSLIMLSHSLEQICRKSNCESGATGKDTPNLSQSPLLCSSPPTIISRPLSHNFKPCLKIPDNSNGTEHVKSTHFMRTMSKNCSNKNINIRVKHEETGDKLKEDLNRIISSSPNTSQSEENPIVLIRKKLTDAHEFLRTKFRLKINTSKYPKEDSTNFYIVVNKTGLIKVTHVLSKPHIDSHSMNQHASKPTQDPHTISHNTHLTPHVFTLPPIQHQIPNIRCDSFEELDDPVNITTVLHSSTIPNSVRLERLLASFIEGPCIYIRPSSMATSEFTNTKLMSIPILHLDEAHLRFSLSFKVPSEIPIESIEINRVDDKLTIKGRTHYYDYKPEESMLESTFKIKIELPEDINGRSLVANVTHRRMLIIEGNLLSTSRRMTCRF